MNTKHVVTMLIATFSYGIAFSQSVTETKTAPAPVEVKVGNVTVAPSSTTTYTQPGSGPTGNPIPGNQRGSSTNTSYGATATIPLPEGKKK